VSILLPGGEVRRRRKEEADEEAYLGEIADPVVAKAQWLLQARMSTRR
jgi:hypothetical protein